VPDPPKTSFFLSPATDADADLPPLNQGKVTAPRVLGIRKVCTYVVSKLGLEMGAGGGGGAPSQPGAAPGAAPEGDRSESLVEILCNDTALDPGMSLATVAGAYTRPLSGST
jgi:WD repeat-containing protein 48